MAAINFLEAIFILLAATCALGWLRLMREISWSESSLPITADWINELSAERYRPMLRLLRDDEMNFLKSQPGFTEAQAAQFRSERARVFRGYLRCLHADFGRVTMAIRVLMVQSRY